jgi:Centromere DNA-binding protein complex CBF3 subunit, domain 2
MFDKTNQEGRAQYGIAFRNKDVQYCPVGAVALWLFYRIHTLSEPWPNFCNRREWYSTKLLSKIGSFRETISPDSHREVCNAAFAKAKCIYLSGTHVGRREGCKLADMLDVPDAQMRRLGRWDFSRMTMHYSSGLPRQGARILAGHGADVGISLSYNEH